MTGPKEKAYDDIVAPLMTKIIDVCKENEIPMFAHFRLDRNEEEDATVLCTTSVTSDQTSKEDKDTIVKLVNVARHRYEAVPPPSFMAFTITKKEG